MIYQIAYSINGNLEEVYFSMKDDALKFYEDILDENKANKDFEYINLIEQRMIAHHSNSKGLMR